jgi:hypothetical protein
MPTSSKNLKALGTRLKTSTAARAKFLSSLLDTLEKNGVDVTDENVIKELNLHLDLTNGEAFVKGLAASTVVVTIVM